MVGVDYLLVNELVARSRAEGYRPNRLDNAVDAVRRLRGAHGREGRGDLLDWAHREAVEVFGLTEEEFFLGWVATGPRGSRNGTKRKKRRQHQ